MNTADTTRVTVFDTTLRDGEQAAGAAMTAAQKITIAGMLEIAGVDVIEAGFPASNAESFQSVHDIAQASKRAIICALARGTVSDIATAAASLVPAGDRARIHIFVATDASHIALKLKLQPGDVLDMIRQSVTQAVALVPSVEFTPEVATTTDFDFLCTSVRVAIASGASVINIADTTGHCFPWEYGDLIRRLQIAVPECIKIVLSTHCHNDRGCATANTLEGIRAGARQVECTVNGIGERAGNAALEEVLMALTLREASFGVQHRVDTTMLTALSHQVSDASGFIVSPNKAFVGRNAFAHESGIHQAGVLAQAGLYEICTPELVGNVRTLPLSKISGRKGLFATLERLGYVATSDQLEELYCAVMHQAKVEKQVSDAFIRTYIKTHKFAKN